MSQILEIDANFRTGDQLPSIEDHYVDIWKFAKVLETLGFPLDQWFPPADTEANSLLNKAFTGAGPSGAALAMAKADSDNLATDLRTLGVWNGTEDEGAIAYTATYSTGPFPSTLNVSSKGVAALRDRSNVVKLVLAIVNMWNPMVVQIAPGGYLEKSVFPDRPGAGWMLYLPFVINAHQVPEAADVIKVNDESGKKQRGSLIVTVSEVFDVQNPEHIKKANAIETRLVDQDLLPTNREFLAKF
ncbi:Immunity protein 52 [Massilia sp. PDC64]|nr:immunity 52 family protein [Massilia sp. PDC64]SDF69889.1 Immunity protein 52 [Massilia sp. PDC64]